MRSAGKHAAIIAWCGRLEAGGNCGRAASGCVALFADGDFAVDFEVDEDGGVAGGAAEEEGVALALEGVGDVGDAGGVDFGDDGLGDVANLVGVGDFGGGREEDLALGGVEGDGDLEVGGRVGAVAIDGEEV